GRLAGATAGAGDPVRQAGGELAQGDQCLRLGVGGGQRLGRVVGLHELGRVGDAQVNALAQHLGRVDRHLVGAVVVDDQHLFGPVDVEPPQQLQEVGRGAKGDAGPAGHHADKVGDVKRRHGSFVIGGRRVDQNVLV